MKQRFAYIDRTKGLAILLVVLGHLIAREPPPGDGAGLFLLIKQSIYSFHMPLFMTVSGLLYGLSWRPGQRIGDDMRNAGKRVLRLLPAYFLFGIVVFFGKLTAQTFTTGVDNPVNGVNDLAQLLIQPGASFCSFLWYIYALALLYVIFPFAYRMVRGHVSLLLPVTATFFFLPEGNWFAWDRLQVLSIFFVIGVLAGRHHEVAQRVLDRAWLPTLIPFLLLLPSAAHDTFFARWTALLAITAVPGLMRATASLPLGFLETLGRYTLIIYLTNTIFIGLVKVGAVRLGVWHASNFVVIATVMTFTAIGGAILLKRYILVHIPPLDRVTT